MKAVWKFKIDPDSDYIDVPEDAQFMHVDYQGAELMVWALVSVEVSLVQRKIIVVGTGFEITDPHLKSYIGTVRRNGLVLHVFEAFD